MIRPLIGTDGLSAASDEALMKAITHRKQHALKELYGRYGKTLKAVITHVVHEEAEADDVLQEIFLQIWREASHYSPHAGKPLGWVVTLARRRAIDRLRRRQAYCRAKDRFEEHVEQQPATWKQSRIDQEINRADLRHSLTARCETCGLSARSARTILLRRTASSRIAAKTKTPLGTVPMWLNSACAN